MPVFMLTDQILFPPVELTEDHGVLAIGGDLSPERLLEAYRNGIFPWYSSDEPLMWWSPDPRFVLFPDELRISKSMRQVIRRRQFSITYDTAFPAVVRACATVKRRDEGTWITSEMERAYTALHERGYAHSVEAWREGSLVGGLYGVMLGSIFFGESMFSLESNASKAAFIDLVVKLRELGSPMIDCQVHTDHLESLGARLIPRQDFSLALQRDRENPPLIDNWREQSLFATDLAEILRY